MEKKPTYEELVETNRRLASMLATTRELQMSQLKEELQKAYIAGVNAIPGASEEDVQIAILLSPYNKQDPFN